MTAYKKIQILITSSEKISIYKWENSHEQIPKTTYFLEQEKFYVTNTFFKMKKNSKIHLD